MAESLGQGQPEFVVPDHISGLEYLVEQIGPETMAQAVMVPEGSSLAEIRAGLRRIESGTMAGILDRAGSSYTLFDRLGRDKLTEALGIPADTSDEDLRVAVRELDRRSWAAELGLDPNATFAEISEEKNRRALAAAIEKYGLEPGASWEDVGKAGVRAEVGLPPGASDEELKVAQGLAQAEEWANTDHRPTPPMPQWEPGESLEDWTNRTQY